MEQIAIDWLAENMHLRAGRAPEAPATPTALAVTLFDDPSAVRIVPKRALRSPAALVRVNGQRRVVLQAGVSPKAREYFVGHELAHEAFRFEGIPFPNDVAEEEACDQLAASIVLPRAALRSVAPNLRAVAETVKAIAQTFKTSETIAFRRVAELYGLPYTVLETGRAARIRGEVPFTPDELERLVRAKEAPKGWAIVPRLTERRIGLLRVG